MRRLPPLNALRAFEAAGRHLSFTKAAAELHVTQAAISHQIKALEQALACQLFRRFNRRLMLTDPGQAFLPTLTEAFDKIDTASRRLCAEEAIGPLKVSVANSFAAKWLLPRLPRFHARNSDIDVQVSASDTLVDFSRDDIDLAIRHGLGRYPGLHVEHLMGDIVYPVCSPRLLDGRHPLRSPNQLRHHTLLHDEMGPMEGPDWRAWLVAAGLSGVTSQRGPRFSHSSLVIQAAIGGQGVALGRSSLVALDLEAGRLVRPFGPELPSRYASYIVMPAADAERPKSKAFREWLLDEAAADRAGESGTIGVALPS